MAGRFLAGFGNVLAAILKSNRMADIKCVAVGPECGKGLPLAVRTCRQTVPRICESRNTIGRRR